MAITSKEFLQRIIAEEPQTFEGGLAKILLQDTETDIDIKDPSWCKLEHYRTFLRDQIDALDALYNQFLREQREEE